MTSHTGDTDNKRSNKTGMKRRKMSGWLESNLPPRSQEDEAGEEDNGEEEEEEEEGGSEEKKKKKERLKRERRQGGNSVTLCKVCNMQLNSGAQAQIHYRGKTHQRRLRQVNKAAVTGSLSQGAGRPMLASLSVPGRRPQTTPPHMGLKHFLPLRVNGSSPLSLFPNFNMMDPVQKAVINHTFGVSPPKKKPIISCNICHLRFNSTTQAEAHYKGHKHARKLRALDTQRRRQRNVHSPSSAGKDREREKAPPTDTRLEDLRGLSSTPAPTQIRVEDIQGTSSAPAPVSLNLAVDAAPVLSPMLSAQESPDVQLSDLKCESTPVEGPIHGPAPSSDPKGTVPGGEEEGEEAKKSSAKQRLHCPVCKVTVNSSSQLEAHYSGSRHKQMLEGQNGSQSRRRSNVTSSPRPTQRTKKPMANKNRVTGTGTSSQTFHCEMCQLSVNSETQLKQHMNSRRHKERLAGKLVKPKFSPFKKVQPSTNNMLATKLALQKHLARILPAGFLASALNPATLCTMASGPLALRIPPGFIHGPLLSPTLFRPAPGPLRATHAPIMFSPY